MIMYFFPMWLLARAMVMVLKFSPISGPELIIRFPRVVSDNSLIFYLVTRNDVQGIRGLLEKGLASTSDVSSTTRDTCLTV